MIYAYKVITASSVIFFRCLFHQRAISYAAKKRAVAAWAARDNYGGVTGDWPGAVYGASEDLALHGNDRATSDYYLRRNKAPTGRRNAHARASGGKTQRMRTTAYITRIMRRLRFIVCSAADGCLYEAINTGKESRF